MNNNVGILIALFGLLFSVICTGIWLKERIEDAKTQIIKAIKGEQSQEDRED